jgi:carbon storage regulator
MLVLTRKLGECIYVGDGVKLTVIEIKGRTIRLGIDAPRAIKVFRSELIASGERTSSPVGEKCFGK